MLVKGDFVVFGVKAAPPFQGATIGVGIYAAGKIRQGILVEGRSQLKVSFSHQAVALGIRLFLHQPENPQGLEVMRQRGGGAAR